MPNNQLPGKVVRAPVGALGCDTLQQLTYGDAKTLARNGFKFCVRYVNLYGHTGPELTPTEALNILKGGLSLMVVQRARAGQVTASIGTSDGHYAAQRCTDLGLPLGVTVWLDLESIDGDVFNYANSWFNEVSSKGFTPGVYVGCNIRNQGIQVSGDQLYHNLKFQHYWHSCSNVPNVEGRGYQMIQLHPGNLKPAYLKFPIDIDVTQCDYQGGSVTWLTSAP